MTLEGTSLTRDWMRGRGASAASRTFPKTGIGAGCCSIFRSTKTPSSAFTTGRLSRPA